MTRFAMLFVGLLLSTSAHAAQFEQGKHYDIIADTSSVRPEVKEYFSFYCPGCNAFEPVAQSLAANLPDNVEFKKVHVDFLRAASPEIQNNLARAYLVAKSQGRGDDVASAIFNQIHRNHIAFANADDIRNLVLLHNIDAATYDKAIKSFAVMTAVRQMKKEQTELTDRRVLSSVPMIVVNGKYKINNAVIDARNMERDMRELIDYLLAKDLVQP